MWIDPKKYIKQPSWLPVPKDSESSYATMAFESLGSLLYDNPSLQSLTKRDRYYLVRKQLKMLSTRVKELGFIGLTMELNTLGGYFLRSFRIEGELVSFDSSLLSGCAIYGAIRQLDCLNADSTYLENNRFLIRWVYTWLTFLAKVPLDRPDLYEPAKIAWLARQEEVKTRSFNFSEDLINLRSLVSWLIVVDDSSIPGKHGPGTTANRAKTIAGKNAVFQHSIQSYQLTAAQNGSDKDLLFRPPSSLWMLVAKDCKSLRPITAEDAAMQYSQQSLKMKWYLSTDFSTELPIRHFVRYRDQSRSRQRALTGSKLKRDDSTPVTVDLHAASDYLSVELVANLFSGNLLHEIMSGRSWDSVVEKETVELGMYAGMGSALTFPVQTTVFTSIAVYSTLVALYRRDNGDIPFNFEQAKFDYLCGDGFRPEFKKFQASIQVYGDDIIVPEIAAPTLLLLLEKCGLVVNRDKSFVGTEAVRESCGIFALGGRDITPLRFRVPSFDNRGRLDSAAYEGLRSLINRSFSYGYHNLYRYLVDFLEHAPLLVSNNEYKRVARKLDKMPNEVVFADYMVFEPYRGEVDYLGIVSHGGTKATHRVTLRDEKGGFMRDSDAHFALTTRMKTATDLSSEDYHLSQAYLRFELERIKCSLGTYHEPKSSEASHTRIPRGGRLAFRDAVPTLKLELGASVMAWGWAPR